MKKEVTQNKWFCDVCGRDASFQGTCELCEKEFCYICEFIGYNPTHIRICKDHQEDEKMKEILYSFSKRFKRLGSDILTKVRNMKDRSKDGN